jgi:hypothetical protein
MILGAAVAIMFPMGLRWRFVVLSNQMKSCGAPYSEKTFIAISINFPQRNVKTDDQSKPMACTVG